MVCRYELYGHKLWLHVRGLERLERLLDVLHGHGLHVGRGNVDVLRNSITLQFIYDVHHLWRQLQLFLVFDTEWGVLWNAHGV